MRRSLSVMLVSLFCIASAGVTWADDEDSLNHVGESGSQPWNQDRNYNPQAIYRGSGRWVLFRTVAEPKRTAYATGVEAGIP